MTVKESKECCGEEAADGPSRNEIANRIDSMLTMHSRKRDELVFRSWLLEALSVISSVAICSMTFYDFDNSESWQKASMNVLSIITVMCSLIWLRSTSKINADKHQEATRQYSKLKKELEGLEIEKKDTNDELNRINKEIAEISDIIQFTERDFIRLKQYRKRKDYYKKHIGEYLSVPYNIALFRMWKRLRREEKVKKK